MCGLIFWQLLLLGFLCYSILLFKGEVDQRKLPPQSVSYVTKGPLMKHLERLPIMVRRSIPVCMKAVRASLA